MCVVFFDDILIYSRSLAAHVTHLRVVLQLMTEHQLYAKHIKCLFGQQKLEYPGHIISSEGVSTDSDKIAVMKHWRTPSNIKQLRGFLGLTGYYRRFIKGYREISRLLTQLLKKNSFFWNQDATAAFENLKYAMTSAPVLALPDYSLPFVLKTDASTLGVGAVLMQQG
ncbi:putative mitochondrial protein AtMg00860 [Apium graveolens]|uniref:putative mitochondrial protein AtMg00860 n=1 Tax=Apium graveolens TaxID=4045 RepID=UPI003D7A6A8E